MGKKKKDQGKQNVLMNFESLIYDFKMQKWCYIYYL